MFRRKQTGWWTHGSGYLTAEREDYVAVWLGVAAWRNVAIIAPRDEARSVVSAAERIGSDSAVGLRGI
ncbi:MAG: hypothetical protein NXI32_16115 [bacterium]|nr:hypothetical protein [bacterium]